jgi:putative nucleotidyltransferase with HDIG domain
MVGSNFTADGHHAFRHGKAEQLEREKPENRSAHFAVEGFELRLLAALEARDGYTGEHSRTVMSLAVEVARQMGLPEEEVGVVGRAALLHDVGKASTPDAILKKRGPLDDEEQAVMQEHVEVGAHMVGSVPGLEHLAPIIRATHERWDGKGYPDGLSGEQIPLASRIIHACDAWHAMTSDRPYRKALGRETIDELHKNMGKQFDPRVVLALVEIAKELHLLPPEVRERMISRAL